MLPLYSVGFSVVLLFSLLLQEISLLLLVFALNDLMTCRKNFHFGASVVFTTRRRTVFVIFFTFSSPFFLAYFFSKTQPSSANFWRGGVRRCWRKLPSLVLQDLFENSARLLRLLILLHVLFGATQGWWMRAFRIHHGHQLQVDWLLGIFLRIYLLGWWRKSLILWQHYFFIMFPSTSFSSSVMRFMARSKHWWKLFFNSLSIDRPTRTFTSIQS